MKKLILLFIQLMILSTIHAQDHEKFPATFYDGVNTSESVTSCNCKSNPTLKVKFQMPSAARKYDRVEVCLMKMNIKGGKTGGQVLSHKYYYRGAYPSNPDLTIMKNGVQSQDLTRPGNPIVCGGFKNKEMKIKIYGQMITGYSEKWDSSTSSFIKIPIYGTDDLIGESENSIDLSPGGKERRFRFLLVGGAIGVFVLIGILAS